METSTETRLSCPECESRGDVWVTAHKTPVVARRALSLHRFKEHGIRSQKAISEALRKERNAQPSRESGGVDSLLGPMPASGKERTAWMKKRWQMQNPDKVATQRKRHAERMRRVRLEKLGIKAVAPGMPQQQQKQLRDTLQQAAWWKVEQETGEPVEIKLSECPVCKAVFRAFKPQSTK